jgi:hypothetical protein
MPHISGHTASETNVNVAGNEQLEAIGTGSDVVSTASFTDAGDTFVSVKVFSHDSILTKQFGTFSPVNLAKNEPSSFFFVITS